MSRHPHKNLRLRQDSLPVSGSVIESDPTPTASSLAQNTAVVADPNAIQSDVPPLASSAPSSSSVVASSAPTTVTNSSPSSGNQISLGTVIGSCVAALLALLLAVLLAFYCSRRQKQAARSKSRNVANDVSRRRSHLELWKRMNDDANRVQGQEQPMTQRPVSGPLGAMFHRTISNASGDKLDTHDRESVGTMRHFAKYHPGLAAEMASQGTAKGGADGNVAKPAPVLHLVGREMKPPISWDGETVGAESFMSLHSSLVSSTSPITVTSAKSTPVATASFLHRWESAEVVHVDRGGSLYSEDRELLNPFTDSSACSIKSKRSSKGRNPFFSGQDHLPVKRTLPAATLKNPFADPDPPRDSSAAIQSLIAALQQPTAGSDRTISFRSSVYSGVTGGDAESAASVTAFPYLPSQINAC